MTLPGRVIPWILVAAVSACSGLPHVAEPTPAADAGSLPWPLPEGGTPDAGALPDSGVADAGAPAAGRPDAGSSLCGNGTPEPGEDCDDGNASACGTCNETCTRVQHPAPALGGLYPPAPSLLSDGESFSLTDGIHPVVRFEFDTDGLSDVDSIRVELSAHGTAINSVGPSLQITAASVLYADAVELAHELRGTFGNRPIIKSVTEDAFSVNGMLGGFGFDCPATTGCTKHEDCARGLVCKPEKLCANP